MSYPRAGGPGCGRVALLALLMVVFPLYPAFRYLAPWGWRAANRLLQPRHSTVPANATLDRLQTARTIVGFLVVSVALVRFDEDGLDSVVDQLDPRATQTLIAGLLALVAGIAVFANLTPPGPARRDLLSRAVRYPPKMAGYAAGLVLGMYLLGELYPLLQQVPKSNLVTALVLLDVQAVVVGYALGFGMRAAFLLGKNVFNAVEVHPLLPAALAPVIAWALAIVELFQASSIPAPIHLVLTLSGAVVVTILAAMEWHYYRSTFGITISTGPHPETRGGRNLD